MKTAGRQALEQCISCIFGQLFFKKFANGFAGLALVIFFATNQPVAFYRRADFEGKPIDVSCFSQGKSYGARQANRQKITRQSGAGVRRVR